VKNKVSFLGFSKIFVSVILSIYIIEPKCPINLYIKILFVTSIIKKNDASRSMAVPVDG
jgi:hypothetical protein